MKKWLSKSIIRFFKKHEYTIYVFLIMSLSTHILHPRLAEYWMVNDSFFIGAPDTGILGFYELLNIFPTIVFSELTRKNYPKYKDVLFGLAFIIGIISPSITAYCAVFLLLFVIISIV